MPLIRQVNTRKNCFIADN